MNIKKEKEENMKNMQRLLCAIIFGLLAQVQSEVVFLDTFDRSEALYVDVNSNLVARQVGGTVGSTYTTAVISNALAPVLGFNSDADNNGLGSDVMELKDITGNMAIEYSSATLDTDFGSQLAGLQWELSYSSVIWRSVGYGGDSWSGFAVGNPADSTGSGNGFAFQIGPTGAWKVYSQGVQVGSGSAGEATYYNPYSVSASFNETQGSVSLSVHFRNSNKTVSLGTFTNSFADGSRCVEFRNQLDIVTTLNKQVTAMFDDVQIQTVPVPSVGTLFLDTFATNGISTDVNLNLENRQAGGFVGSTYSTTYATAPTGGTYKAVVSYNDEAGGLGIGSDVLLMTDMSGNEAPVYSAATLDTDFGTYLDGHRWALSYTSVVWRATGYGGDSWSGFAIGNPPDGTGIGNGFAFKFRVNGSWVVYSGGTQVGTGGATENSYYNPYSVSAVFDESAGTVALSVHFRNSDNTFNLGTFTNSFADSSRCVEMRNQLDTTLGTVNKQVKAMFDHLKIELLSSLSAYGSWSNRYALVEGSDGDDDNDGLSNLYEFGLGGNPTNSMDMGNPAECGMVEESGTNWMCYVYPMMSDTNAGLQYGLELTDDLVNGSWTNAGYVVLGKGTNAYESGFDAVTNRISTEEMTKFVRLKINQ